MTDTTFVAKQDPTVKASWLNDVNIATYRALGVGGVSPTTPAEVLANLGLTTGGTALIGYTGPGGFERLLSARELDQLSVKDFGALGDGTTDDTAAINAAALYCRTAGKMLYFPACAAFYKVTAPLSMGGSCHWFGESGAATIIRRTSGSGHVLETDGSGSLGPYLLDNLRIGGVGCIGIASSPCTFTGTIAGTTLTINAAISGTLLIGDTISGAGVSTCIIVSGGGSSWVVSVNQTVGPVLMTASFQYTARLEMKNVNFESDLLTGVDINGIYFTALNCTWGIYTQTSINAAFKALKSNGNGVLNSNINVMERCSFFNCQGAGYAIEISSGTNWRFTESDWEGCLRCLSTVDIQSLLLEQCYCERITGSALAAAFSLSTSQNKAVIRGGTYDGNDLVATASMFGFSDAIDVEVQDIQIFTSASAFAYLDTTSISHTPTGRHHFKDIRLVGNAADPILWMDHILEGNPVAWTPSPTGLTVILGGGTATYAGTWTVVNNRTVFFTIRAAIAAPATAAATAGTTYFTLPAQFTANGRGTCSVWNEDTPGPIGTGFVAANGRVYLPSFAAQSGAIDITGQFNF